MTTTNDIDYGPLKSLVGVWTGAKGHDVAPEPDGEENNPYYETITFTEAGDVTNAEEQVLAALHYRQIVKRKSNDKIFHDETGYWMWDAKTKTVMHSLVIPRGVCVLAGGIYNKEKDQAGSICLSVEANINNAQWGIIQSAFMQEKARTIGFKHTIKVVADKLSYAETMSLEIYGKTFEHTDKNELIREAN